MNRERNGSILSGVTVQNGIAAYSGGGISCSLWYGGGPTIVNCIITGNSAPDSGGGIYYQGRSSLDSPIINNCIIKNNSATNGGGISIEGCNYTMPIITNCIITENIAAHIGGGWGGGIFLQETIPTINNCTITNNSATGENAYGGGICSLDASPNIIDSRIIDNFAAGMGGGGIGSVISTLSITNCIIAENVVSSDVYGGSGISSFWYNMININNCTITGNMASVNGGGIDCEDSSMVITNSILWNDTPQEIYVYSGDSPTITYSDIQGGYGDPNITHNINADPLFVDPNADYHLLGDSPCIDSGTGEGAPDTDIEGVERPQDGDNYGEAIDDMGAYEFIYGI